MGYRLNASAVLLLAACGKREAPPPPAATTDVIASATAPAASAAAPTTAETIVRVSGAVFEKDALEECVDFEVVVPPDVPRDIAQKIADGFADAMLGGQKKPKTPQLTRLGKPCSEQFRDRLRLASCKIPDTRIPRDASAPIIMRGTSSHYSFERVTKDDYLMKECLEMKGEWDALPRDSAPYRRAAAEARRTRLLDTAKKLEQLGGAR